MRYRAIAECRGCFPIRAMCRLLGVSASGFYAHLRRPESERARENRRLLLNIKAAYAAGRGNYGSPRVHRELKEWGISCSRRRVARLMRENGIRAKRSRRFRVTTNSEHAFPVAANILDRNFAVEQPDKVWAGDITYVPTGEGFLYLAALLDLSSRFCVGFSLGGRIDSRLTVAAFDMALGRRNPTAALLHHSDQGVQYACSDYRKLLEKRKVKVSMSRKGDPYDNAPVESFFATLKTELVHHRDYKTREEAKADIFEYIEVFYNRRRRHSALGYISPAQFEARRTANATANVA